LLHCVLNGSHTHGHQHHINITSTSHQHHINITSGCS